MTGDPAAPITVEAQARDLIAGGAGARARVELREADFRVARDGRPPLVANYRDATTVAVDQGRLLLILAGGAARLMFEGMGDRLGTLVSELRERRARQTLHDRFIEVPDRDHIELVEYALGDEHGVAQIAYHAWGVALLPLDERRAPHLVRRSDIGRVEADAGRGRVSLPTRPRPAAATSAPIELIALGDKFEAHRARLAALHDGALADAATLVGGLLPDAPFTARQAASSALVDGRPVSPTELGDAWPYVERAVLVDPTFGASYRALVAHGSFNGQTAPSWLALAPRTPGQTDEYMSWFFVGLPGNLVAFELVSQGAHATYLYRVVPRGQYAGQSAVELAPAAAQAVFEVSECLIDTRFLREPIYLTDVALADPRYVRYRFAIAALPSLRAARWRFVGRLIHTDEEAWSAALDDAIAFNAATNDDGAVWQAGAIQETD